MKTKMLAILAVLAMAFAGVAVLAEVSQSDADGEVATAASSITVNEAAKTYDKYLDKDTANTDEVEVTITASIAEAAGTEGAKVTLTVTPADTGIQSAIANVEIIIASGETTGTGTFKINPSAVGTTKITIADASAGSQAQPVVIPVTVRAPAAVQVTSVFSYGSEAVENQKLLTVYGNPNQVIGVTYTVTENTYEITTNQISSDAVTVGESGKTEVLFNYTPTTTGTTPEIIPKNVVTFTILEETLKSTIYTYENAAGASIVAYAKDTNTTVQAIWYGDAKALIDLSKLNLAKTSHVKVKITAGTGEDAPKAEFIQAAQKQIWVNAAGVFDPETLINNAITITSEEDSDINYALTSIEYKLILDSVKEGAKYNDGSATITLPYVAAEGAVDLGLEDILVKDHEFTKDGNGENAELKAMTPNYPGYVLVGYGLTSTATADAAIEMDFATIEDLVFAYGVGDNANKIYAIYEVAIYNINLAIDDSVATDLKFVTNQAWAKTGAATLADMQLTATDAKFLIKAPSIATKDDLVLVRASQVAADTGLASGAYTYEIKVYTVNATKVDGKYTAISLGNDVTINYETQMLANGIWTVKGIDQDVFIMVKATASTGPITGYELQMESVKNTSAGVGTAIATFTVGDITLAEDATLSMAGTFFITDESGRKVYADLANVGNGMVSYTAKKDFVNAVPEQDVGYGKLKLDNTAVDFALTMDGTAGIVGFYAIKAVYTIGDTAVESPYALGEVSA